MTNDTPSAQPRPPGFVTSSLRIFDLSIGEMLWSRRTISWRCGRGAGAHRAHRPLTRWPWGADLRRTERRRVIHSDDWARYVRSLNLGRVPAHHRAVTGGLLRHLADGRRDRRQDDYIFVHAADSARGGADGKYLAYLGCTVFVVLPSVVLVYLLIVPLKGSLGAAFPDLLKDLLLLGLGLAVYGAVFAFVGAKFNRPLLIGLIFIFGWEQAALAFPGYLKQFTVMFYLQAIVPHAMPNDGIVSMIQGLFGRPPAWRPASSGWRSSGPSRSAGVPGLSRGRSTSWNSRLKAQGSRLKAQAKPSRFSLESSCLSPEP